MPQHHIRCYPTGQTRSIVLPLWVRETACRVLRGNHLRRLVDTAAVRFAEGPKPYASACLENAARRGRLGFSREVVVQQSGKILQAPKVFSALLPPAVP